jgi:geranylgeranyl pyrophosphate synthase
VTAPASLETFIDRARAAIDAALDRFLPAPPRCPALVSDAMRYSLFAGGKRLRPLLALAAADAVAITASRTESSDATERAWAHALPAACALEFIHTYSLIHDDLPAMDNDTLRRGRPTLHVVYGDAVAILAGDALQAEAFSLMAREPGGTDPDLAARKLRVLHLVADAAGASGMVGGQTIDIQAAGQAAGHHLSLDADGLREMHLKKTGALIRASAVSGAIMAGADEPTIVAVDRWAADVGLTFQIVDDVLDVEGTAGSLGKSAGKDAASQKPTYPAMFGVEGSRHLAAECATRAREVLRTAGLTRGWLDDIANWVTDRRS